MSAKTRYNTLAVEREVFLLRARECSRLTMPMVIRPQGADSTQQYDTNHQSVGARGVMSLTASMVMSLIPPGSPFYRLLVSDTAFDSIPDGDIIKAQVAESISKIETTVLEEIVSKNMVSVLFEVVKFLLIAGNSLVYVQPDGNLRNYSLEDYVCHRDIEGNVTDIIIREVVSATVAKALDIPVDLPSDSNALGSEREIELFTAVRLQDDGSYKAWQEVNETVIKDTEEIWTKEDLPWLPIRLSKTTGESYGRPHVESVIGDLKSLEALSKAIVETSAIAAKTIFFVDPNSTTNVDEVASAENGDVISGKASDVTVLTTNKGSDLNITLTAQDKYETRLSLAFNLLDATLPGPGAKTATEINAIVASLDKVLAGAYAMLAADMMAPLVHLVIVRLTEQGVIPALPPQVKLIISTGLSALGRNTDLERMQNFLSLAMAANPQRANELIDWDKTFKDLQDATGVKMLKSVEMLALEKQAQKAAMEAQAKQDQFNQEAAQGLEEAKVIGDLAKNLPQEPPTQSI